MIDKSTYTIDWIEQISKQNRNTDKILIEKVIRALTLLTELKTAGLEFIFKGGTALMLMLNKPLRLSIDIDIIVTPENSDLKEILQTIIQNSNFIRYEEQKRIVQSGIEKAHYKFFYSPVLKTHSEEEYILLDVLFEVNPYSKLIQTPIQSPFIKLVDEANVVQTPTFENILGDKLTAFAPNTTGIPYFKGKTSMSMEIIKQLYDIANLFDVITELSEIKNTFEKIAINELKYRKLENLNPTKVLDDIIQTALCICSRGQAGYCQFTDIQHGIKRISGFIYSKKYVIEDAIISASKAAYLASLIKNGANEISHFTNSTTYIELLIKVPELNKMNKLKKALPEAFWYWYQTALILKKPEISKL